MPISSQSRGRCGAFDAPPPLNAAPTLSGAAVAPFGYRPPA
jgi:hypothetical protein